MRMSEGFWLSDAQWRRLAPLLPNKSRGVKRVDDRRVISGIVHVLRSGGRWIDAPASYGPRKTLYNRFVRWAAKGIWRDLFHVLAAEGGPPAELLLDSTHVRAHRCATGGKGGSKARRSASAAAVVRPSSTR
jgi:transposase